MALEDYTPQTDFSQDEANQVSGRSTVRTTNLDAEFSNLETSIDSIIARLQAISRDDAALQDAIVTYESLSPEVVALIGGAGFTARGAWLTATAYAVGDLVTSGTGTYVCATAHTSGVFATDLSAGKWLLIFDSATATAAATSFTPAGGISATDVQAALEEIDSEKMAKSANGSDIANATTFRSNISAPSKAELQLQTHTYAADTGTSDALAATLTPAPAAYATGLRVAIKKSASASSSTAPTLDLNALGAKVIYTRGGQALVAGDMPANAHLDFEYDAALNSGVGGWELKNPFGEAGLSSIIAFSGILTPSTITADQDNYNPTGLSTASTLRLSSNAARQLTGLAGGSKGRLLVLHNIGSYALAFPAEDAASTAANRFIMGFTLEPGRSATLQWDDTSNRWRPLAAVYPLFAGSITPAQITADQNDYSPTGLSGASVIRITTDSTLRVLTGLAGGADGRVICIDYLSGSGGLKLADDSASSTAANRFDLAADVTLTAPCIAVLKYDATSSRWRVMASPSSGAGKIKQIVFATKTDTFSTASTTFTDLTGLSVSLTPTSASNKVLVMASILSGNSANNYNHYNLVRDSTIITQGDTAGSRIRSTTTATPSAAFNLDTAKAIAIDTPGDTSAHTYKVQMAVGAGTGYVNRSGTDTDSSAYSRGTSTIIAVEYEP